MKKYYFLSFLFVLFLSLGSCERKIDLLSEDPFEEATPPNKDDSSDSSDPDNPDNPDGPDNPNNDVPEPPVPEGEEFVYKVKSGITFSGRYYIDPTKVGRDYYFVTNVAELFFSLSMKTDVNTGKWSFSSQAVKEVPPYCYFPSGCVDTVQITADYARVKFVEGKLSEERAVILTH